jgi:hypothetical protein
MVNTAEVVAGLRALADFLEQNPKFYLPNPNFNLFVSDKEELAAIAREHGPVTKHWSGDYFWLRKQFGGGVDLEFNIRREQVCKLEITKKTVTRPKMIQDGEETVEVEEQTWSCDEPLLAKSGV